MRRLITRLRRPIPEPGPTCRELVLEAELDDARARIADLEAAVAVLRLDTAPVELVGSRPSPVGREALLRERETNRRLAGEVHRLTMANIAADKGSA